MQVLLANGTTAKRLQKLNATLANLKPYFHYNKNKIKRSNFASINTSFLSLFYDLSLDNIDFRDQLKMTRFETRQKK